MQTNSDTPCLWRAVDHMGEVQESYVTKRRDRSGIEIYKKNDEALWPSTCHRD
jgi:hypothetical protein